MNNWFGKINIELKEKSRLLDEWFLNFINVQSCNGDNNNIKNNLSILFRFSIMFICIIFLIGFSILGIQLVLNICTTQDIKIAETFGVFGDFIGGSLNPILTFLTFMGLLITIVLQQTELRESRLEFERTADALVKQNEYTHKQSFESTFFQMLTIHNTIVDAIENQDKKGRDCFTAFYSTFAKLYVEKKENYKGNNDLLEHTFEHFWKDHQTKLGHYYRFLYNIVRFVAESDYKEGPYIRLIRAQLSDQELLMLFYNSTSKYGQNFKKYIEDFKLLNNMPTIRLLEKEHIKKVDPKAFQ